MSIEPELVSVVTPSAVVMRASAPKDDGGFLTMEITLPAGATSAEIAAAIVQWEITARVGENALAALIAERNAALPPERIRVTFLKSHPRGITLGELALTDRNTLDWLAGNATDPKIREQASRVIARADATSGLEGDDAPTF